MNNIRFLLKLSFLLLFIIKLSNAIIAYKCDNETSSVLSLSLVDTEPCVKNIKNIVEEDVKIKLIQPKKSDFVNTISCLIEIEHSLFMCGKSWEWNYAESKYLEYFELNREECMTLHKNKLFKYNGITIDVSGKRLNGGFSILTFGRESTPGTCESSETLYVNGKSYPRAMRDSFFKVKLDKFESSIDFENDKINFKDGSFCKYSSLYCFSTDLGNIYWDNLFNPPECNLKRYTVIYEGYSKKIIEKDYKNDLKSVSYSIQLEDHVFQLWADNKGNNIKSKICTYNSIQTVHPNLQIIESKMSGYDAFIKKEIKSSDIDMFTYINSKLIYSVNIIRNNVEDLYYQLRYDKCLTDKKLAQSYLTTAYNSPLEFAYQYFERPGYSAAIMGEVIYIFQCKPVSVNFTSITNKCYKELTVTYNNQIMFVTPRTKVLIPVGTEVECTSMLPTMHKINGIWYATNNRLTRTEPPTIIKNSDNNVTWSFSDVNQLAQSGIYTQLDLERYQLTIMNPLSHGVITQSMGRILEGHSELPDGYNAINLIDNVAINNLKNSLFDDIFGPVLSWIFKLGNIISFIFGIIFIINILKYTFISLLHGKILYETFGFSLKLLTAFFSGLFHLTMNDYYREKIERSRKFNKPIEELDLNKIQESAPVYSDTECELMYPRLNTRQPEILSKV